MGAPAETLEPARRSLQWMTPWTWAIADRRFHQGVLIRFGHASSVTKGTGVRLLTLCLFWRWDFGPVGLMGRSGRGALSFAVFCEAIAARCFYAKGAARPIGRTCFSSSRLEEHRGLLLASGHHPIDWVYWSSHWFHGNGPNAQSRRHLGGVGPLMGSTFLLRSVGHAFNEVVVKHAGAHDARRTLFGMGLAVGGTASLISLGFATPLGAWYFEQDSWSRAAVGGVGPLRRVVCGPNCHIELHAFVLAGLLGSLSQNQSHHRKCGVLLVVDCSLLALGVWSGKFGGLVVAGTGHQCGLFGPRPLAVVAGAWFGAGSIRASVIRPRGTPDYPRAPSGSSCRCRQNGTWWDHRCGSLRAIHGGDQWNWGCLVAAE